MASPAQRMGVPQPAAVTWARGGTRVNAKKPRLDDGSARAAMERIAAGMASPESPTRDWGGTVPAPKAMGPFAMPGGGVSNNYAGMGPNAAPHTPGKWDGPLGRVPTHHGWAGLQSSVKDWTLRILGAFPDLRFSSGFRTPAENAAVNGRPNSGHMRGWKIDLSGSPQRLAAAAAWAKRYGARVLLHDAGSGYHLDISWEGVPA